MLPISSVLLNCHKYWNGLESKDESELAIQYLEFINPAHHHHSIHFIFITVNINEEMKYEYVEIEIC